MALTFATGKTFANGEKVTPAKLNQAVNAATITGELEVAKGGTGASTAAGARTNLGLGLMALNSLSVLEDTAVNVNQTGGATGAAVVFTAVNAPQVDLTVGKWLLIGTVTARMSDTPGEAKFEFSDNAGANAFGHGASKVLPTTRDSVTVIGYKEVTVGTFSAFFKATPVAGSTINLGSADSTVYAGGILAIKLE